MRLVKLGEGKYFLQLTEKHKFILPSDKLECFKDISVIMQYISEDLLGTNEHAKENIHILGKKELIEKIRNYHQQYSRALFELIPESDRQKIDFELFINYMTPLDGTNNKCGFYNNFDDSIYALNQEIVKTIKTCTHEIVHRAIANDTNITGIDSILNIDHNEENIAVIAELRAMWFANDFRFNRNNEKYIKYAKEFKGEYDTLVKRLKETYTREKGMKQLIKYFRIFEKYMTKKKAA